VTVAPSPWWLQRRLLAAGLRPINNVVDATNHILLERGQPLHAFDATRLRQKHGELKNRRTEELEIVVRRAKAGESLKALDGNTYKLRPEDLVIADTERAIALAGVIGGEETGVTEATTRIVLECANFDPLSVRRTSRALGIRTESSIRFEKGLPPESVDHTIARAVELLTELAGGTAARPVIVGKTPPRLLTIRLESKRVAARIGAAITPAATQKALTALGCKAQKKTSGFFSVTPPWWRRGDLEGSHDLVEEVARVYGYHRLPSVLPTGTLPAAAQPPQRPQTMFDWEDHARNILIGAGATEVLMYSLTGREDIERCGFATDQALALENPLSEDLAYLRPSVIPTLLPLIAGNQGHTPSAVVFEVGNVFIPQQDMRTQGQKDTILMQGPQVLKSSSPHVLPREEMRLCIAAYGRLVSGGHTMKLKGIVAHLLQRLGIRDVEFHRSEGCLLGFGSEGAVSSATPHSSSIPTLRSGSRSRVAGIGTRPSSTCLWHPGRTMDVIVGSTLVGVLGEIHPTIVEACGIDQRVAVAELDWAPILAVCGSVAAPAPPPQLPAVKRDLAFTVDRKTPYTDIAAVLERFDPLLTGFELFDQFEGGNLPLGKKSLAFHLTFEHLDHTLTAAEADGLLSRLTTALQQRFGAVVRE
jgi:phenylalanyl-tRNA synthetase beta chain